MANKKRVTREQMEEFTARLIGRPELYEQFVRILDLTDPAGGGKGLDVNMLESFLIPEIRETGRIATQDFAQQVEQSIGQEVKQQDGEHKVKKKAHSIRCLWID